jgi:hypothetical protein
MFNPNKKTGGLTNATRAGTAEVALLPFREGGNNTMSEAMTDLITNLRHLCDREKIDFTHILILSEHHWQSER